MNDNRPKYTNGLSTKSPLKHRPRHIYDAQLYLPFSLSRLPASVVAAMLGSCLFVSGCSDSAEYPQSASEESADYANEVADDSQGVELAPAAIASMPSNATSRLAVENLAGDSEQPLGSQATDVQIAGKELIVTAHADFKVADVVKSKDIIENLTRQHGGYVALSKTTNIESGSRTFIKGEQNVTVTTYYRQATMTLRIPRQKMSAFLKQIEQQVAFLNEQTFSAQDVTLDIYREQLASQLNRDMARDLAQERLNSQNDTDQSSQVDSITATYAARQQQEYAQLEQMNIADKIKYSTIDLVFSQPASSYKETTQNLDSLIEAERPSFTEQVSTAFIEGWEMLKTALITLIQLWWLVILGGIFYLLYRAIKAAYRKIFTPRFRMSATKREEPFGAEERDTKTKDTDLKQ